MSLDAGLLQRNIQSQREGEEAASARSGGLRSARRSSGSVKDSSFHEHSLRERLAHARRNKSTNPSSKSTAEAHVNPLRKSTSGLLRQAWLNVIDSYGLTLLWIDVHFFLHGALGSTFFCPPGEEWTDRVVYGSGVKKEQLAESLSYVSKGVGTAEKALIGCVNIVLFLIIFAIAFVLYLLIDRNPIIQFVINLMKAVS